MLRQHQPLGEPEPVAGKVFREGGHRLGGVGGDLIEPLVVVATVEVVGHRQALFLVHHVRHRAAGQDRPPLLLEGIAGRNRRLKGLVKAAQPPVVELGRRGRPLVSRQGDDLVQSVFPGEAVDLGIGEPAIPDGQPRQAHPMGFAAAGAAADRQRHLGANRVLLKAVGLDVHLLSNAVVEHRHAARGAGAVVAECDERPAVSRQLLGGHHLEGVVGPGVNQVHPHPPLLHPEVPAAIHRLGRVHAGEHRVGGVVGGGLQPAADGEGLVKLEAAHRRKRGSLAGEQGRLAARPILPGERCRQRHVLLLSRDLGDRLGSLAFSERQLQQGRVLREPAADAFGCGRLHPRFKGGLGVLLSRGDRGDRGGHRFLQGREPRQVVGQRHRQDRRRVFDVAVHRVLGGVIEEG